VRAIRDARAALAGAAPRLDTRAVGAALAAGRGASLLRAAGGSEAALRRSMRELAAVALGAGAGAGAGVGAGDAAGAGAAAGDAAADEGAADVPPPARPASPPPRDPRAYGALADALRAHALARPPSAAPRPRPATAPAGAAVRAPAPRAPRFLRAPQLPPRPRGPAPTLWVEGGEPARRDAAATGRPASARPSTVGALAKRGK